MTTSAPRVIAIDGPAGSGKSTTARAVARQLGLAYLDTGARYRSAELAALRAGVDLADAEALAGLAEGLRLEMVTAPDDPRVLLDGEDVTARVREADVTAAVSAVAAVPAVRAELVRRQREEAAASVVGLVADGRDLGTVVYPDALVRVFLTASPEARARRRAAQDGSGSHASPDGVAAVAADLARRDAADTGRAADPLRPAEGALIIDNSELSLGEVTGRIVSAAVGLDASLADAAAFLDADLSASASPGEHVPAVDRGTRSPVVPSAWLFRLVQRPLRLLFRLLFRIRVEGADLLPQTGPVLVVGNHSGFLDGPLVVVFARRRRVQVLAKVELFDGALGRFMRAAGQIPVHRGHPDRTALRACTQVLLDGGALAVFPEGTRGEGMLDQVRHGAAYVLIRSALDDVPIVPVVCWGTAEALPRGARFPRLRREIKVVFGAPFTVPLPAARHSRQAVAGVAEDLRTHLVAHLETVAAGGPPPSGRRRLPRSARA